MLAIPALVGLTVSTLLGSSPAMAAESTNPSTTPTFNAEQEANILELNVESSTPSFGDTSEIELERVAVKALLANDITVSGEVENVVVAPAAAKELKIERATMKSSPAPKPKPKPKVVETERAVASTNNSSNSSTTSNASTNAAAPVTRASRSAATVSSSSDAVTRDSRSGSAKTYADNKVALDYKAEGKGMEAVVAAAHAGIGSPYVWGGNTPSGWDCSGFVKWAYAKAGINIARGTSAIRGSGQFVRTTNPQPGDLIFQNGGGHVGIYLGGGQMIGAQNPSVGTIKHSVDRNPLYGYYTLAK